MAVAPASASAKSSSRERAASTDDNGQNVIGLNRNFG
jgi:hypothetical protein